jgi:dienelactone hydrolase
VSIKALFLAIALASWPFAQDVKAQSNPASVIEEPTRLPVTINGRDYALDALIVHAPGDDKRPVALITHGANPGDPRAVTPDFLRGWAHDLAHRGWLVVAVMRRGYGNSDGEAAEDAGTCVAPDTGRYLDAHAEDLEAALHSIAKRPDADMARVLAVGVSTGGAAVMALAARPSVHLSAVVNVSGGLARRLGPFQPDPACAPYESDLVWNFARIGATAHMPTLWLYAENDSFFRPGLIFRMRDAFTGAGGKVQLIMLPPFQADGHALFYAPGGRQLLLPELDNFLRTNGLPTWNLSAFDALLARLSVRDRQSVATYLTMPTEKALVLGPQTGTYWWQGAGTLDTARTRALAYCKEQVKAECSLGIENFTPVTQPVEQSASQH